MSETKIKHLDYFKYSSEKRKPFFIISENDKKIQSKFEKIEEDLKTYKHYKDIPIINSSKQSGLTKENIPMYQFYLSFPMTIFLSRLTCYFKAYNLYNKATYFKCKLKYFFGINLGFYFMNRYTGILFQKHFRFF